MGAFEANGAIVIFGTSAGWVLKPNGSKDPPALAKGILAAGDGEHAAAEAINRKQRKIKQTFFIMTSFDVASMEKSGNSNLQVHYIQTQLKSHHVNAKPNSNRFLNQPALFLIKNLKVIFYDSVMTPPFT